MPDQCLIVGENMAEFLCYFIKHFLACCCYFLSNAVAGNDEDIFIHGDLCEGLGV
jgi:hypothetical protein